MFGQLQDSTAAAPADGDGMKLVDYFTLPQKDGQSSDLPGTSQNHGECRRAPEFVEYSNYPRNNPKEIEAAIK